MLISLLRLIICTDISHNTNLINESILSIAKNDIQFIKNLSDEYIQKNGNELIKILFYFKYSEERKQILESLVEKKSKIRKKDLGRAYRHPNKIYYEILTQTEILEKNGITALSEEEKEEKKKEEDPKELKILKQRKKELKEEAKLTKKVTFQNLKEFFNSQNDNSIT